MLNEFNSIGEIKTKKVRNYKSVLILNVTYDRLVGLKRFRRETFDEVVCRLLDSFTKEPVPLTVSSIPDRPLLFHTDTGNSPN